MNFTENEISDYYSWKNDSYLQKYRNGYFTHVHTGLYNQKDFPFLFSNSEDFTFLGLERIRHLLFRGQEDLSLSIFREFNEEKYIDLLDCGCGYCGTSMLISQNLQRLVKIHAISLSQKQLNVVNDFLLISKIKNIKPELINIFNFNPNHKFDGIFSIDATCQIGNYNTLFKKLNSLLSEIGKIVISDNFLYIDSSSKENFDNYWKSNISNIKDLIESAKENGLTINKTTNLTHKQLPFWALSKSHSMILLNRTECDIERKRLLESINFHEFLTKSFLNKNMQYFQIVLGKE